MKKKQDEFEEVNGKAGEVINMLKESGLKVTCMESCTGGGLAYFFTNISGASEVIRHSSVTYANEAKELRGVDPYIIEKHSVYSLQVAEEMARASNEDPLESDIGVGITGSLSRVDPNNAANSVLGEVYIAVSSGDMIISKKFSFDPMGERYEAKNQVIMAALDMTKEMIEKIKEEKAGK